MQLGARILAGATTGSMCVLFAQPTDVVKVRYQAQIRNPGVGARYVHIIVFLKSIECIFNINNIKIWLVSLYK